jgi:hypothetical protein
VRESTVFTILAASFTSRVVVARESGATALSRARRAGTTDIAAKAALLFPFTSFLAALLVAAGTFFKPVVVCQVFRNASVVLNGLIVEWL